MAKQPNVSISVIAQDLGISRQALWQMMRNHPSEVPLQKSDGKYNREEMYAFWKKFSNINTDSKSFRERIYEQEYRLKKVKADEAEKRVIPKALVIDLWRDTDVVLENALKRAAQIAAKKRIVNPNYNEEALYEEILEDLKPQFKRWRDFVLGIN